MILFTCIPIPVHLDCDAPYDNLDVETGTVVVSPNYPNRYDHQIDCAATLSLVQRKNVVLYFLSFYIDHSSECTDDYLEIRSVASEASSSLKLSLCGSENPSPIDLKENAVYLKFSTDHKISRQGFKIQIEEGK